MTRCQCVYLLYVLSRLQAQAGKKTNGGSEISLFSAPFVLGGALCPRSDNRYFITKKLLKIASQSFLIEDHASLKS